MTVLGCLGLIALVPLAAILDGYALATLWGWFMVPSLHLPPLTVPYAIGISMVVGMLTHQNAAKEKYDDWYGPIIAMVSQPLLALAFGWVVTLWI